MVAWGGFSEVMLQGGSLLVSTFIFAGVLRL